MNKETALELIWIVGLFLVSLLGMYNPYSHSFDTQVVLPIAKTSGSIVIVFPGWILVGAIFSLLLFLVYLVKTLLYRFKKRVPNLILLLAVIGIALSFNYFQNRMALLPSSAIENKQE